jgi:uncharacterized protein YqeY
MTDAESVLRHRLAQDLRAALKSRDSATVGVLRTILGAIDNAGAVTPTADHQPTVGRSSDVARRTLSPEDLEALLHKECSERERAISEYDRLGRGDDAAKLRHEVTLITRYLGKSG